MSSGLPRQLGYTVRQYRREAPGDTEALIADMQFEAADKDEAIAVVESALAPKFKPQTDRIELLDEAGNPVWRKDARPSASIHAAGKPATRHQTCRLSRGITD